MNKLKYKIGDLVKYAQCLQYIPDIGIITDIDEFGDHRVVWTSGGIGWYSPAELEEIC